MTLNAVGFAKKEKRAAFFRRCHGASVAARELVNRRIGKHKRELEFRNGLAKHEEIYGRPRFDFRKHFAKALPVRWAGIEDGQSFLPYGFVARSSVVR